jgi:MoxR-like ATPase
MSVRKEIQQLQDRVSKDIIGQEEIVETLILGLLANGNILVEGLPGLAKTRAIKSLSRNIEGTFGRIQFTPDLTAGDITGREVVQHDEVTEKAYFKFMPGPVFNNVVLADEINRAPSKTQNALLEAMEERQVTVAGVTHKMPGLFLVMATQNPIDQAGTFALPEAQLDRFLMHISVHYPDEIAEAEIIRLLREEMSQKKKKEREEELKKKSSKTSLEETKQQTIFDARGEIDNVEVPPHIEKYMVEIIFVTRNPQRINYELKSYIELGSSPRGSLALDRCSRVYAWLKGEDKVSVEHVQKMAFPVLRHRFIKTDRARKHKILSDELIEDIVKKWPVPKEGETIQVIKSL